MSSDGKGDAKGPVAGTNGGPKGGGGKSSSWKDIVKDENIAKAVGAVVFGGIAYNIYRSSKNKTTTETTADSSSSSIKGAAEDLSVKKAPVDGSTGLRQHKVTAGETLFSLSKSYKVPVAELRGSNLIVDDKIWIGQVLNIPS